MSIGLTYTDLKGKGGTGVLDGPNFNEDYLRRLIEGDQETERQFTSYFSDLLRIKLRSRLRGIGHGGPPSRALPIRGLQGKRFRKKHTTIT